ncbi:hypothetical protein G3I15_12760 [Streptomyces sp. SID10244]|nr:hypothetical protein [Streptomyces sp. SID10244]
MKQAGPNATKHSQPEKEAETVTTNAAICRHRPFIDFTDEAILCSQRMRQRISLPESPSNSILEHPAAIHLKHQLAALLAWEISLDQLKRSDSYRQEANQRQAILESARHDLRQLFEQTLSARSRLKLGQPRLHILATGRPPEFDQQIVQTLPSRYRRLVYVETLNAKYIAPHRLYRMVLEEGEYRIDEVSYRVGTDSPWCRQPGM